jgi:hypothetical protein
MSAVTAWVTALHAMANHAQKPWVIAHHATPTATHAVAIARKDMEAKVANAHLANLTTVAHAMRGLASHVTTTMTTSNRVPMLTWAHKAV